MNIVDYYIQLFSSPAAVHSFLDYVQEVAAMIPVWALLIWIFAISFAGRFGGRQEEVGVPFWVRFSWAWASVLVSLVLLLAVTSIWFAGHLNGWQSVAPHCTLAVIGCGISLGAYFLMNREVKEMQTIVSQTR